MAHRLDEGLLTVAAVVGTVDGLVPALHMGGAGAVEGGVFRHLALLQRRRQRNGLIGGTRLVGGVDALVAPLGLNGAVDGRRPGLGIRLFRFIGGALCVDLGKLRIQLGLQGIVNTYGSTIIPCRYNKIQQEGNIYYVTANGKKGIFNRYGSTIIPCQYDEIISLGHRYIVKRDKKFGVYNQYGSTILPCQFQKIECLNNGHYVTTRDKSQQVYNAYGALLENRTNMKVVFSTED